MNVRENTDKMNIDMKKDNLKAKPFVKWAGGKYRLADELIPNIYKGFNSSSNTYFEPMVGSGGFFFKLSPNSAYLSDINTNLVNTYNVIKNELEVLLVSLDALKERFEGLHEDEKKDFYYNLREMFNNKTDLNSSQKATFFIFLNKLCFNGLYRENSHGHFNVPIGTARFFNYDEENIRKVNKVLQNVEIGCHGYEDIISIIKKGDFVYLDPPYIPLDSISFTQYSKDDFGKDNHLKLSDFCNKIDQAGAYFMLSNSDTEDTRKIYSQDGRYFKNFMVNRSIASKAKNRVKAKEIIVTNYEL